MKKTFWIVILALAACLATYSVVFAQGEALKLTLIRDWGYGGFNNDIQGTFTMKVSGPTNLVRVEYYIDDTKIGEVSQSPFNLQFITDHYPAGVHHLSAVGTAGDGSKMRSNQISTSFISAADSNKKASDLIIPILVVVFAMIILSAIIPLITERKTKKLPRKGRETRAGRGKIGGEPILNLR